MGDSSNWLVHDHRKYEAILEECELAAGAGDWRDAKQLFVDFVEDMKLHMRMEDEVLYPLLMEEAEGSADAIADLLEEHDHIARLLHDLAYVIRRDDIDHFETSLPPLHEAMLLHNAHEETVFNDLANPSLLMRREEIMARLEAVTDHTGRRHWDF